jgi:hypothetical protein
MDGYSLSRLAKSLLTQEQSLARLNQVQQFLHGSVHKIFIKKLLKFKRASQKEALFL